MRRKDAARRNGRTNLFTRPEVADAFGISRVTVERLAASGQLGPRVPRGKSYVYPGPTIARAVTGSSYPCMACWASTAVPDGHPGARADRYDRLAARENWSRCGHTPEEEAGGPAAAVCEKCARRAVDPFHLCCYACGADVGA